MTLSGCSSFGTSQPTHRDLPTLDPGFKQCFDKMVPKPKHKVTTAADAFDIIKDLKSSELEKSQCGKRLIAFYDNLK